MTRKTQKKNTLEVVDENVQKVLSQLALSGSRNPFALIHVDAADYFINLNAMIPKGTRLDSGVRTKVLSVVRRWIARQQKQPRIVITQPTIVAITSLVTELWKSHLLALAATSKMNPKLLKELEKPVEDISALAKLSNSSLSWLCAVEYANSVSKLAGIKVDNFLSATRFSPRFVEIRSGLLKATEEALAGDQPDQLDRIASVVSHHSVFFDDWTDQIDQAVRERMSLLSSTTQEWLMRNRSFEVAKKITYAEESESADIKQAAALLLFLWDNREDSSEAREAFERYRQLCERSFHLFLGGKTESEVKADLRVHELLTPASAVRVRRPYVEWRNPPKSRIVIRALVTPVSRK